MNEQPTKPSPATKENLTPIIEPKTKAENSEVVGQPPEQLGVPVLAADSDGKLLGEAGLKALNEHIKQNCKPEPSPYNAINKPEQPNTELLIIKTIQGLMSAASRELTELNKITSIAKHKVLIDQVLEDIDSTEKNTLFKLQKAFE